jgi:peptidoglycan/xylan/chitin deacetylase (PgdA/CDA1 family)
LILRTQLRKVSEIGHSMTLSRAEEVHNNPDHTSVIETPAPSTVSPMNQRIRSAIDRRTLLALAVGSVASACSRATSRATARPPTITARPTPSPVRRTSTPAPSRPSGPAREITHGHRGSSGVALTFHTAGDPAIVDAVLTAAKHANAKLTMLVVGTWLEANPSFAHRILTEGHDLGNHTWSHPVLPDDDAALTRTEIRQCQRLLTRLTGSGGTWFRPSGTPHATSLILREAGAAGYPTSLSYDVDPLDYTDPGASAVTDRVLAAVLGGSIVSLHTLYAGTADALPEIFRGLRQRNLHAIAATQLLGRSVAA